MTQKTPEDRPELQEADLAREEAVELPERTAMSLVDVPATTSGLGTSGLGTSGLAAPAVPGIPTPDTSGLTQLAGSQPQGPYSPDITSSATSAP